MNFVVLEIYWDLKGVEDVLDTTRDLRTNTISGEEHYLLLN